MRSFVACALICVSLSMLCASASAGWTSWEGGPTHNLSRADLPGFDFDPLWTSEVENAAPSTLPDCTTADAGQVFVFADASGNPAQQAIYAVDASDGSVQWESAPIAVPRRCPALDSERVYASNSNLSGGITAFDRNDGSVDWSVSWGAGQAMSYPTVSGGHVIVNGYDALTNYVIRSFDATTGEFEWAAPGAYNTTIPPVAAGGAIVGIRGQTQIGAVDPDDGSSLWTSSACNNPYQLISEGSAVYCVTADPSRDLSAINPASGAVLWSHSLTSGHIGDIAADSQRVYLDYMTGSDGEQPRRVRALAASDGSQAWDRLGVGSLNYGVSVLGGYVFTYDDADVWKASTGDPAANAGDVPRLGGNIGSGANISPAYDDGVFFHWAQRPGGYVLVASTDVTPPTVSISSPATDPSYTQDMAPGIEFDADDGIGTLDRIEVSVDAGTPSVLGASATSFEPTSDLSEAAHTFNVTAFDLKGNSASDSVQITVDITPPDTTIAPSPSGLINDSTPTFGLSSNESPVNFECRFDSQAFAPCSASHTPATALGEGPHSFEARAIDAAGNVDASSATRSITVDSVVPQTTVDSGPAGPVAGATPSFTFSSDEDPATFECRFDSAAFAACSGPGASHAPASPLPDGAHIFAVRATDAAANVDATPATRSFSVDTTPPVVRINSGPSGTSGRSDASFAFGADEPGVTFECKLDSGTFQACTAPANFSGLGEGGHTLEVRGTDAVGHPSSSSATRTWEIDLGATTETVAGSVEPGGSVSTDPAGEGPSPTRPAVAAVVLPDGGEAEITVSPVSATPPAGFSALGLQFEVTAPAATAAAPLAFAFRIDSSAIPAGTDLSLLTVTRDGQPAENCSGPAGVASPDPCLRGRTIEADGDVTLAVLSSHASSWNLVKRPDPVVMPTVTPRKHCKKGRKLKKGKCVKAKRKKKRRK